MNATDFISIDAAVERYPTLGCRVRVYKAINEGRLPAYKSGKLTFVTTPDVEKYVLSTMVPYTDQSKFTRGVKNRYVTKGRAA
jgi:hypothetical protein